MIVVAILAVMIGILLPSLARASEQAKAVKCVSNLNAIFKGMFYYTSDTGNGRGFIPHLSGVASWPGAYWATQIHPYIKIKRSRAGSKDGLLVCPSDPDPHYRWITGPTPGTEATLRDKLMADTGQGRGARRRGGSSSSSATLGPLIEPVSYAGSCDTLETRVIPGIRAHHGFVPIKWTEIDSPHCYLMLTEVDRSSGRTARCFRWTDLLNDAKRNPDFMRHYGKPNPRTNGSNFLFGDGHAQWHSAQYASDKLICCVDFGVSPNSPRIPTRLSNMTEAINAQRRLCGGPTSGGGTRRR